jgi:hypothetical protein
MDCTTCNGAGAYMIDGETVPCRSCDGAGMDQTAPDWMGAAQRYLARLGAAEYQQFLAQRKRKTERYAPSPYHATLCNLLGKDDEQGYKSVKLEQGYCSALGF